MFTFPMHFGYFQCSSTYYIHVLHSVHGCTKLVRDGRKHFCLFLFISACFCHICLFLFESKHFCPVLVCRQGCTKLLRDERKHATQETLLVGMIIIMARIVHSGDLLSRASLSLGDKSIPWRKSKHIINTLFWSATLTVSNSHWRRKEKARLSQW